MERLHELERELEEVKNTNLEFLPKYGGGNKSEIIALIEEDIKEVEDMIDEAAYDYTNDELEDERRYICESQGLLRYC